jgi:hypothetical protein
MWIRTFVGRATTTTYSNMALFFVEFALHVHVLYVKMYESSFEGIRRNVVDYLYSTVLYFRRNNVLPEVLPEVPPYVRSVCV